jgi:hypothetical protein
MMASQPVSERWTAIPLLASIAVTALMMAVVIVWQATSIPIVALLLIP